MSHEPIAFALSSTAEFARLIGVSPRRVSALVADGVVLRQDGKILTVESIQRYAAALERSAAERMTPGERALREARGGLIRTQRELLQDKLGRETAQVLTVDEVREGWAIFRDVTRRTFEELPKRLESALAGRLTAHDRKVLAEGIRDVQRRVADELEAGTVPGSMGPGDLMPTAKGSR
jgi:hypothetical protein